MTKKKYFFLAALASVSLMLTACNTNKKPVDPEPPVVDPDDPPLPPEPGKTVSQIIVKENTVPTSFMVGDTFSVEGGRLQVRYSDSTREEIDMTLSMITNAPDMSVAHEDYEVNVSYEGAQTSYYINVIAEDTRQEVSIGVEYEYNDGPRQNMVDNISFYVGKPYKFYYGCYPNEAVDSLGVKYYEVGGETPIEKPTEVGNYIYKVYIAEGDDTYKPVSVEYHYAIIPVATEDVIINSGLTLTNELSEGQQEVEDLNINYKNAKAANDALLTLVKQADADAKPTKDDNYVEIATPVSIEGSLKVDFGNTIDDYLYVYGSYDLEHYFLVDTLARGKQTTSRANDYCFIRLVAAPLGHNELTINSIEFTQEIDGAPGTTVARSERGDRFNHVSSAEDNGYFHRRTNEVFDENYSNKSIGIRLKECSVRVDLGTTLTEEEVKYYQVSFKVCPTEDAVFNYAKDDPTVVNEIGVYVKSVLGDKSVGAHKKVVTINHDVVWTEVTVDLITLFDDGISQMNAFNVWLNRYCATGAVVFDDFRLIQKPNYPVVYALTSISLSGMTTEYIKNATFDFDGVITAHYSDYSENVIAKNDPNLTISAPNMASSGTKEVIVTYTDGGVTKTASYFITVTASGNPKDEETLPIVADSTDLANNANRCNPEVAEYMGCAKTSNETEITYGNSQNSLRIYGPTYEEYCHATINLPQVISASSVTVKFFAKNLPCNLILQLRDEAEAVKAQYSSELTTGDCTTDQTKNNKFTATDAGNDWTLYEHTYSTANVTNGVKRLRILFRNTLTSSSQYVIIDGLEVY